MSVDRLLGSFRVPNEIKRSFIHVIPARFPEQSLFQNVAARVILDAVGVTGLEEPAHTNAADAARRWFEFRHKDVEIVFDLAGINPEGFWRMLNEKRPAKVDMQRRTHARRGSAVKKDGKRGK